MKTKIVVQTIVFVLIFLSCAFAEISPERRADIAFGESSAGALSASEAFSYQKIAGVPPSHMIDKVPLIVQGRNECGPTTLSMIMNYHGIKEVSQVLKSSLKWHAENGVSYQNMIRFPYQKYGLELAFAGESNYKQLLEELSQDHPVLVRQWANAEEKRLKNTGHWRIAVGYDQKTGKIYLNDPMFSKTTCLDSREFLSLWDMSHHSNPTKNYMLLLRKATGRQKDQMPSTL